MRITSIETLVSDGLSAVRVRTDEGLVGLGHFFRAHLMNDDFVPLGSQVMGCFTSGKAATDDMNEFVAENR